MGDAALFGMRSPRLFSLLRMHDPLPALRAIPRFADADHRRLPAVLLRFKRRIALNRPFGAKSALLMPQTSDLGLSALSTINREAFDKPSTRRFIELPRSPPESARNIHAKSRKRARMMVMVMVMVAGRRSAQLLPPIWLVAAPCGASQRSTVRRCSAYRIAAPYGGSLRYNTSAVRR